MAKATQSTELPPVILGDAGIWLLWHGDTLAALGLKVEINGQAAEPGDGSFLTLPTRDARVRATRGRFDAFEGAFDWPYEVAIRQRERHLVLGSLRVRALDPLRLALIDADQRVWLIVGAGHPRISGDGRQLDLTGAELRIGGALADWLGATRLVDQPLAAVLGRFPLREAMAPAHPVGCPVPPRWPGSPIDPNNPAAGSYRADVRLIDMTPLRFLRCRQLGTPQLQCDGPGGFDGEVALAPDAVLQNSDAADAADVPWYPKFLGVFPPYGNDQHPFLVWNLYRADADGYLSQVGRSGLKHAFVTINNGCTIGCPPPPPATTNHVLYPNCSDVYSAGTNDSLQLLSPRSELIPAQGLWARCGSAFDPDCDGVQNVPGTAQYEHRLVARESAIDPNANPNARFFADAWYVVRDDVNIDNTMGSREVQPEFISSIWDFQFVDAALLEGPMVARWTFSPLADGLRSLSRNRQPDGEIALGARVERIGPTLWRYRYVLANLDFARATTSGSAPNLRIDSEHGISAMMLPVMETTKVDDIGFRDGDTLVENDWSAQVVPVNVRWQAPNPTAELRWGALLSFGFDSATAPGYANATIDLAGETGAPSISLRVLVPGGELHADGFE